MNKWYAVMRDRSDNDWGYGSYDLDKAKKMLKDMEEPAAYIAVIEMGSDPICIEELSQDELF